MNPHVRAARAGRHAFHRPSDEGAKVSRYRDGNSAADVWPRTLATSATPRASPTNLFTSSCRSLFSRNSGMLRDGISSANGCENSSVLGSASAHHTASNGNESPLRGDSGYIPARVEPQQMALAEPRGPSRGRTIASVARQAACSVGVADRAALVSIQELDGHEANARRRHDGLGGAPVGCLDRVRPAASRLASEPQQRHEGAVRPVDDGTLQLGPLGQRR